MSIEAMKLALEALENVRSYDKGDLYGLDEDIAAIRVAIEQAGKPWVKSYAGNKPNYTVPEQRQWVGLTAEEVEQLAAQVWFGGASAGHERFAKLIEAKLKDKNT
jgi:hypothetical protein